MSTKDTPMTFWSMLTTKVDADGTFWDTTSYPKLN